VQFYPRILSTAVSSGAGLAIGLAALNYLMTEGCRFSLRGLLLATAVVAISSAFAACEPTVETSGRVTVLAFVSYSVCVTMVGLYAASRFAPYAKDVS
jgi:hypothetical protein